MATEKTRALRKYEADPVPCAHLTDGPPLDLYSPFGPMLGRATLPGNVVDRVNAHADARTAPGEGSEFVLPEAVVFGGDTDSLAHHTAALITRYLEAVEGTRVRRVEFETFWIVSQYAGTPSPVHFHSGDVSGVAYLKIPTLEDPGREAARNYISGRQAGMINFLDGGKQQFSKSLVSFAPVIGDIYLFPAWLLHGAEAFRGEGERRSMAFNAYVDVARS